MNPIEAASCVDVESFNKMSAAISQLSRVMEATTASMKELGDAIEHQVIAFAHEYIRLGMPNGPTCRDFVTWMNEGRDGWLYEGPLRILQISGLVDADEKFIQAK